MPLKKQIEAAGFEKAAASPERFLLSLFVTGATPRSARAIQNLKRICEEQIPGRYELEIVDLYKQPDRAQSEQIVAAPTLIRRLPLPVRRILGDLSNESNVMLGLGLVPKLSPGA